MTRNGHSRICRSCDDVNRRQLNAACDCTECPCSQGGADSLLLGVEIEGIMSHLPSPARLLVAAEKFSAQNSRCCICVRETVLSIDSKRPAVLLAGNVIDG